MSYLLQWNMGYGVDKCQAGGGARELALAELIEDHRPDFIALQEASLDSVSKLRSAGYGIRRQKSRNLLTGFLKKKWSTKKTRQYGSRYFLGVLFVRPTRNPVHVYNVHLPSRLRKDKQEIEEELRSFSQWLRESRARRKVPRDEIVVGDLNLSPYDDAVQNERYLDANRALKWAKRTQKKKFGDRFHLFNPSWSLLGCGEDPLGTHYYTRRGGEGPWFVLDQIIVSPALAGPKTAKPLVITKTRSHQLAKPGTGAPNKTEMIDHFPVLTELDL